MRLGTLGTILQGPQSKTVFSHSTVNFSCSSDTSSDIYWNHVQVHGSSVFIFDRRGRNEKLFDERFVKTLHNFTSILTIHKVQKSDEGTYICHESIPTSPTSRSSARLTVNG